MDAAISDGDAKHQVPSVLQLPHLHPELERNAPEPKRQEHKEDGKVEGRHDNPIGNGECGKQSDSRHNEPCFVAVPCGRDGVDHVVPSAIAGLKQEQYANPQIRAIEHHIKSKS
jgi:hypothetical protein